MSAPEDRCNRQSDAAATASETSTASPLCTDAVGVARMLDVSVRTVRRLDDLGKLPAPLQLGRSKRWSIREVEEWIAAGSPPRREWTAMRRRGA